MPSNSDQDLLARLNALKRSHISLDRTSSLNPLPSTPSSKAHSNLDLNARFQRLSGSPSSSAPTPSPDAVRAEIASGGGKEGSAPNEDDETLDGLLQELSPENQWSISESEQSDIKKLVNEVRQVLPAVKETRQRDDGPAASKELGAADADAEQKEEAEQHSSEDEGEADEYVEQALVEAEVEKKQNPASTSHSDEDNSEHDADTSKHTESRTVPAASSLDLPAVPTSQAVTPPSPSDFSSATAVDDALTARMAALSLPSTPSFTPAKKDGKGAKTQPTDKQVDSWCIICYDDAEVKCLGCDGDLYCRNCWREGHTGDEAGYEEKMHRWVEIGKSGLKKKKKVSVGA